MPNPWMIVGALGMWIVTGLGSWFYRGHIDAGEKQAALDARAVQEQTALDKAEAKGRADTQKLADDQANRANQAELELAKEKSQHAADIKASHAGLKAALGNCRVNRSDVRVLDGPAAPVPSPAAPAASSAAGQQRDDSGTVGAVTIVETCERNKGHFDANLVKLGQCTIDYNELRSACNGTLSKLKGKTP